MIGKGHAIASTGAAIDYGWNQEKEAEIILKEYIAGETPREITEEFQIIQSQNERCIRNTLSFILSPTVEDGKNLKSRDLEELAKKFLKEMNLQNNQAVGFVHRDKEHTHVHVYVNRIGFDGKAYNDSFIGKKSQLAADQVAKELGFKRVQEVQRERLQELKLPRLAIKQIHEKVLHSQPKSLDEYMRRMKQQQVKVIPCINKSNQLQGFRFEYKGINLKGSDVHRSMTGSRIAMGITQNSRAMSISVAPSSLKIMDKTVQLSTNLVGAIAKNMLKQMIKKSLDIGIGY